MTLPEDEALRLWEAMFGNAASAKGGNYTCDYKRFIELIKAYGDSCRFDELENLSGKDMRIYKNPLVNQRLAELQPQSPEKRAE